MTLGSAVQLAASHCSNARTVDPRSAAITDPQLLLIGPTNNWPVYSLILHCGQLILRKISIIGASRCQILRLKCTKFTFCWGSAPTSLHPAMFSGNDSLLLL